MNQNFIGNKLLYNKSKISMIVVILLLLQLLPLAGHATAAVDTPSSLETVSAGSVTHVVYVNGSGSGLQDGSSADNAVQWLSQAYGLFASALQDGETAVVLVSGPVTLQNDPGLTHPSNRADNYALLPHQGTVVITSQYGAADYTVAGSIAFDMGILHLMGDTRMEHLTIRTAPNALYANFHTLHMGMGIVAQTSDGVAVKELFGATNSAVGISAPLNHTSIIIDSGKYNTIFGGGSSYQGATARAKDYNTSITINGGVVTSIFGTGAGNTDNAHQKNVEITLNGGRVWTIYGAHKESTVYGKVRIYLNGGTVTSTVYGGDKYVRPASGSNTAFTPTLYGGVEIRLQPQAAVSQIYGGVPGANIAGDRVVELQGFGTGANAALLPGSLYQADILSLSSSFLQADSTSSSFWSGLKGLRMKDDSRLRLNFIPPSAERSLELEVARTGPDYAWDTGLVEAPYGTANLFRLRLPLNGQLAYEPGSEAPPAPAAWSLSNSGLSVGQQGTPGVTMDVYLGLPAAYNQIIDGDTPYEQFQQRLGELGGASHSARVLEPALVQGEVELYVAPSGNDDSPGTREAPLKTIAKALDFVAALQASVHPRGIVVYLREGTYLTTETIVLGQQHSGTEEAPVVISAYPGEQVSLSGGTDISGGSFSAVTDEAVRQRLHPDARDQIVVADLQALGITEYGAIQSGTTGGPTYQVFMNGTAMQLARYPNVSSLSLGQVLDIGPVTVSYSSFPQGTNANSTGIEYVMQDLRPLSWLNTGDIWIKGALYAEWNIQNHQVNAIHPATNSVKLKGGTALGAVSGPTQTYYYYNVLEELDLPGEYFLDREAGLLYMYPAADVDQAQITLSVSRHDLIRLQDASNVVLNGLTVEYGGGNGIVMNGDCSKILIQNSTVSNMTNTGVVIRGKKSGIIYSTVQYIGNHPISIPDSSGYFNYTPDHNFIQNNYVHHTGLLNPKFGYIILNGIGNVISHNLIQNTFSVSIYNQTAQEAIVEYNEIVGGPTGTFDGGSIYAGGPVYRHNHYRYNYIHDIFISTDGHNPHGIYMDEMSSENYIYGNVFDNVPNGFFTNSGGSNIVINNVIVNGRERSHAAIYAQNNFGNMTLPQWLSRQPVLQSSHQAYLALSSQEKAKLRSRNPVLSDYYDDITIVLAERAALGTGYVMTDRERRLVVSNSNYFVGNISYNHKGVIAEGMLHTSVPNLVTEQDPFIDYGNGDLRLKPEVETGFDYTPVPLAQMGRLASKQGISGFQLAAPHDGSISQVYSGRIVFQWTPASGADSYRLTIARDEALTQEVRTLQVEDFFYLAKNDPYFTYGETYYWTVTAYTRAQSRLPGAVAASGGIHSFTTMTEAEYLARNRANTDRLEEALSEAGLLYDSMVEGTEPGQYASGAKLELDEAIQEAEQVLAQAATKLQEAVDAAVRTLNQAVEAAIVQQNISYVTLSGIDASHWQEAADAIPPRISMAVAADVLELQATGSRSELLQTGKLGQRDILLADFRLDSLSAWNGFALRQSGPGTIATSTGVNSYFITVKEDQFELQKRKNGISYGNIAVAANNGRLTGGQWHRLELGAVSLAGGQVRIIFKVDDEAIFDYVDTSDAITEKGYFGIVVQPVNGTARLRAAAAAP
ncbi:MAG: hypothetical protein K0R57_1338 [Paenibacillaceae bacterium]|jgi:hypothetical protein|nr:hypothetical protein [Paenibacillaceae bacterium]